MAELDREQIKAFLEALGRRYSLRAKLILLGGSALCLLGSPRPTIDIDYAGSDLQKDELQVLMDEIANEMGLEVEAVPIQEFTPLAFGDESHSIHVGRFGKIEVSIIDPYVMALSKLDRGFSTDIEDIVFLIERGLVSLSQLEQIVKDALLQAREFEMDPCELQSHLQTVREEVGSH